MIVNFFTNFTAVIIQNLLLYKNNNLGNSSLLDDHNNNNRRKIEHFKSKINVDLKKLKSRLFTANHKKKFFLFSLFNDKSRNFKNQISNNRGIKCYIKTNFDVFFLKIFYYCINFENFFKIYRRDICWWRRRKSFHYYNKSNLKSKIIKKRKTLRCG